MAVFKARYRGTCDKCKAEVSPGQYVSWSRRARGIIYHARCIGEPEPQDGTPQDNTTTQQEQAPAPTQQAPAPQLPGISEERVRDIAREEDAGQLGKLLTAVEERLDKRVPRELHITVSKDDGTKDVIKRVSNAHVMLVKLVYLIRKRKHAYLYEIGRAHV